MSEQELLKALAAEDAQPSAESTKLEQEIDNLDPSKLPIGLLIRLSVLSKDYKLVWRDGNTTGSGEGPKEGKGNFYGPGIPNFFPQSPDQTYILGIRGGEAFLTLRKGHKVVFNGKYTGAQQGLDGIWKGKWSQHK